jgi:hypothetical protein
MLPMLLLLETSLLIISMEIRLMVTRLVELLGMVPLLEIQAGTRRLPLHMCRMMGTLVLISRIMLILLPTSRVVKCTFERDRGNFIPFVWGFGGDGNIFCIYDDTMIIYVII